MVCFSCGKASGLAQAKQNVQPIDRVEVTKQTTTAAENMVKGLALALERLREMSAGLRSGVLEETATKPSQNPQVIDHLEFRPASNG
jgi:hypothetical protein